MNSRLYHGHVMHQRLSPKTHGFRYGLFMFYLDLDELDQLHEKLFLFSYNRVNWFTFRDKHHVQYPLGIQNAHSIKQNVLDFLKSMKANADVDRIMLLTHVAVLGYVFNPISVYFCFDHLNNPLCAIAEVCNTHGEMKMYLLDKNCWNGQQFELKAVKNFYVSPFSKLDSVFHFIFPVPERELQICVDNHNETERFLLSALSGTMRTLTDSALLRYGLKFPFITLRIIFLIHWQALRLRMKGLVFRPKTSELHLQQKMFHYK